jgi:hypothetical protein
MAVAVGDEVARGKTGHEPFVSPAGRPAVVNDPEAKTLGLDHEPLGQGASERELIHVPVDGRHGSEPAQLVEHGDRGEVAEMHDEVGGLEEPDAVSWKAAGAAWEVRVPEERDQGMPSRKRPSR